MDAAVRREIIESKGKTMNGKFVDNFEKEWQTVTARLKRSRRDLSKILLVTKEG